VRQVVHMLHSHHSSFVWLAHGICPPPPSPRSATPLTCPPPQALGERLAAFLAAQRPVILLGDLNISPYPIDSCSPSPDFEQSPSRQWLRQQLVEGGGCLLDVFRACHPLQREAYTCWSTATGARVNNYGTRIDLVLAGQPRVTLGSLVTGCPHGCALSQRRQQPQQQQQHEQQQQQQQQATTSLPGLQPSVQQPQQQGEGQQRGQEQQQEQGHLRGGPTSQHLLTPVAAGAEPASSITTSSSSSSPLPHHLLEVPVACPCLALWSWVAGCDIWAAHQGSDHAPVVLQLAVPQVLLPQGCPSPPLSSSNVFKGRQCSLKGWLQAAAAGQPVAGASTGPGVQQAAENRMQHTQSAGGFSQSSQQQQQPQGAAEHHRVLSQTNGNDPIRSTGSQPNSSSCGASSTAGTNGGSSQGAGWAQAAATGSRKRGAGKGSSAGQQTLAGWVSKQGKQPGATPLVTPAGATRAGGFACQPANLQRQQPPQPLPQPQPTVPQGPPAAMHQEQPQDAQQLWQAPLNTQSTAGAAAVAAQPHTGGDWTTAGDAGDPGGGQGGDVAAHGDRHTQALAAWQRIQQAMAPPKCKGHGEPCKIQTVKKKGPNNGRQFYVCSRADGPPPVGRCDHFEWCRHREVRGQVLKRPGTAGAGQAHKRPASASK
jgi:hypothetical protein